ncbi:alginate export family protein [Aliiglaciecola litoralis]|uniref:Alginate export domain-containing protein n=1 Tax=Aliiglaciecola litoralis TaxID=582857 RepID=A0ABN1LR22_9ALTE
MKTPIALAITTALTTGLTLSPCAQADGFKDVQQALKDGQTNLMLRYRYERVDQDNIDKTANASTLLTRLGYKSASINGFFGQVEVDNVTAIGNENYNSTVNGHVQYPVVADPTDTDLNQAFIGYKTDNLLFTAGRQQINHNDQRFVGGVGWRQNEQTYDGYRLQYNSESGLSAEYSYVYNVNRIFGPNSVNSDLGGNLHLFNIKYAIDEQHKITGFIYELDFETANAISTRTIGTRYEGNISGLNILASYARQSDTGDNPTVFSTDYLSFEVSAKLTEVNIAIGYASLGSDNGQGFTTPLATLHKFQGFTDKFLNTPANGVNDLYLKASGKLGKLGLSAIWHKLDSDVGAIHYGSEINLVANYPLYDKVGLLIKYANYSADGFSVDTNKLWGMLTFKF